MNLENKEGILILYLFRPRLAHLYEKDTFPFIYYFWADS
jgi:hypothetical protein